MIEARILRAFRTALALLLAGLCGLLPNVVAAQEARFGDANIAVAMYAEGPPPESGAWMLALRFRPRSAEWHGYWANPGDAGQGMDLTLDLPEGMTAGEPIYPVPRRLLVGGLMNHVYEGEYTVLVPVAVAPGARRGAARAVTGFVSYLACTDRICVPQDARLRAAGGGDFDRWRAHVAPQLDSLAGFEIARQRLRIGIALPADLPLGDLHLFVKETDLGGGLRPNYAAIQTFVREGDLLVAEVPLVGERAGAPPARISGILDLGGGQGVRFEAVPRDVPLEGLKPLNASTDLPGFWVLALAALAGGLLLNVMPCVFPILSLKALALAKAGGDERTVRRDALAYTAGVIVACAALGALIVVLRAAGQQVGWAFQLQEPGVVLALLALTAAITANFLDAFELPGFAISGRGRARVGPSPPGCWPPSWRPLAPDRSWRWRWARR